MTGGSIPLLCLEGVPDLPGAHQDEALAHYSVSREVPRSLLKSEKLLGTLDATPKVPDIPVSLEENTELPGTTSSETLLPS